MPAPEPRISQSLRYLGFLPLRAVLELASPTGYGREERLFELIGEAEDGGGIVRRIASP